VCEHCGCKGVPAIGELMQEHAVLLDEAERVRAALAAGDRGSALDRLTVMVDHLARHVRREETGIFAALRKDGEYADEVFELESEHTALDTAIVGLDASAPDLEDQVNRLLEALAEHIEREDLGIFPVSAVTLGRDGWAIVDRAHEDEPTFLRDGGS
jgi:hemerythrin-like domain-containing protein